MRIRFGIDAQESVRRGVEPAETLDLDPATLSPEDRALVARYLYLGTRDGVAELRTGGHLGGHLVTVPAPTAEGVVEALRALSAAEAARARAEAERREAAIREALAAPLAEWVVEWADGRPPSVREHPPRVSLDAEARRDPRVVARRDEAARVALPPAVEAYRRAQAAEAARREAERREAAGREAALREWAVAHDERARLLVEEGHRGWRAVAEAAWHAHYTPPGWAPLDDAPGQPSGPYYSVHVHERTKPTVQDVYALRGARQLAAASGGVLADARLAWVVLYRHDPDDPEADADGDVPVRRTSAVLLDVVAPTGARRTIWAPADGGAYAALAQAGRQA